MSNDVLKNGDKLYFMEFRMTTGTLQPNFLGQSDFMPDDFNSDNWLWNRIITPDLSSGLKKLVEAIKFRFETIDDFRPRCPDCGEEACFQYSACQNPGGK